MLFTFLRYCHILIQWLTPLYFHHILYVYVLAMKLFHGDFLFLIQEHTPYLQQNHFFNKRITYLGNHYEFTLQVLLAIQYPVQLMYQHGSATPDTFSRLPATRFLPPLRFPAQQQSERTGNSLLQSLKDINVRFLLTAGQVQPVRLPDFPEC